MGRICKPPVLAYSAHGLAQCASSANNQERPRRKRSLERAFIPWVKSFRSPRSEEHTSELHSLMRISYAVFCLKKKKITQINNTQTEISRQSKTPSTKHPNTNTSKR